MKFQIIPSDGTMLVDGVARPIDVSDMDADIHALLFDSTLGKGCVWFKAETNKGQANITSFAAYQVYADRWAAAAPLPPPPPPPPIDFSNVDNVEKALKALGLVVAAWNGKTPAQLKAAFKSAWDSLL